MFYDEDATFQAVIFLQYMEALIRPAVSNDPQARGRRSFIDVHPLDLRRHAKYAIPFLTRYLRITRPLVILGMGQHVYTMFACDVLFQPWRSETLLLPRIARFLNDIISPLESEKLEELLDLPTIATRAARRELNPHS